MANGDDAWSTFDSDGDIMRLHQNQMKIELFFGVQFNARHAVFVVAFKLTEISCRFSHSLFVVGFAWRRLVVNQYHSASAVGVCPAKNVKIKSNRSFLRLHFWAWVQLNINGVSS